MKTRAAVFVALLLAAAPMFAAFDAYLQIDGIKGESTESTHKDWIDVLSFSWGVTRRPTNPGSAATARSEPHDFTITKVLDKSSPKLQEAAMTGRSFPSATLEVNGERHLLQNVMVKSVRQAALGDGSVRQTIEFTYQRCATHENGGGPINYGKVGYKLQTPAGKISPELKIDGKVTSNGVFSLGGGPQGPIILQDLHFVGPTQAVINLSEAGNGMLLPLLRRAQQSKQQLSQLTVSGYQTGGSALDHKSSISTFTFHNVTIAGISSGGDFTQLTLTFSKFDGPMAGFHNVFPK